MRVPHFPLFGARSGASRGAVACAMLAVVLVLGAPAQSGAAADDGAAAALHGDVERLRTEMERAYLDVERDHARVRADGWGEASLSEDFASVLEDFVRAVRARPAEDVAGATLESLDARHIETPLTRTSLRVVLAALTRDLPSRDDRTIAKKLFVDAARRIFSEPKVEDVWDASFLSLPAVVAFRKANSKLAYAQETAPPPAPAEKPPEKTAPTSPAKPLEEMIFFDKARPWIGPWTGWTTDLTEAKNKRQQRAVKAVWADRYEVTCAEYRAYLANMGPASRRAMLPQGWTIDDKDDVQFPAGRDRHPVTGVTWRQAQSFAESLGKRLPTCDEWERIAGGSEKDARTFPWGNGEEGRHWAHLGAEPKGTFPVDAFPDDATPEGVIGMAGNVAEIVSTYPDHTDVPKAGPDKSRQVLVCGGSFTSRSSECSTCWRWVLDADDASEKVGFRCVMDDAEYKKRLKK